MYKNNKTGSFAETKLTENYVKMSPEEIEWLEKYNGKGFMVVDGECIINPNYPKELKKIQNKEQINLIKQDLENIDKQRTRALAEPEIKDIKTGETWLEYYNRLAKTLREELQALESEEN